MTSNQVVILGIESSCDETSAAVIKNGKVLANIIANQDVHIKYGGVVPELAGREHQKNIVPVVAQALKQAGITVSDIDAIAYTAGPGLIGSLLVGSSFAKGLALSLNKPLVTVNHMQAHVLAHFIDAQPEFPFLCLTVSGGHTQIVLVKDYYSMEIIGETIDDAAGEAFDKCAKILGLPYPGGPLIDKYAALGNPEAFKFALPKASELNYSFSGLKTSVLYFVQDRLKADPEFVSKHLNDLCASVQKAIIDVLVKTFDKAVKKTGVASVALAGGVSANSGLRKAMNELAEKNNCKCYIPAFQYCTDNAAMVAIAGYYKYKLGSTASLTAAASARIGFDEIR